MGGGGSDSVEVEVLYYNYMEQLNLTRYQKKKLFEPFKKLRGGSGINGGFSGNIL